MEDEEELLEIYLLGFEHELCGSEATIFDNKLHQTAYQIGRDDAFIGDDVMSNDYRSKEEILMQIYNQKKNLIKMENKPKFVNIKLRRDIVEGMISTYECLHYLNSDKNQKKETREIINKLKKSLEI
jgi:hypothetical protein